MTAGTTTLISEVLNTAQDGLPARPPFFFLGLTGVLLGIIFISQTHEPGEEDRKGGEEEDGRRGDGRGLEEALLLMRDGDGEREDDDRSTEGAGPSAAVSIRARRIFICVAAGVISAAWSPLSTFALRPSNAHDESVSSLQNIHSIRPDPYTCYLLFSFGGIVFLPLIMVVTMHLDREGRGGGGGRGGRGGGEFYSVPPSCEGRDEGPHRHNNMEGDGAIETTTAGAMMVRRVSGRMAQGDDEQGDEGGGRGCPQTFHEIWLEFQSLSPRRRTWGLATGIVVGIGYLCFFLASAVLPTTISFAITSCGPLVAVVYDIMVVKAFTQASTRVWILLIGAMVAYGSAIVLLSLATSK